MATRGFVVGQAVDVLSDCVFCPATVLEIVSDDSIRVHFVGWDASFDTVVTDLSQVYPAFSGVLRVKAWFHVNNSMPSCPCVALVRCTDPNDKAGQGKAYLQQEMNMYIIPIGAKQKTLHYVDGGIWIHKLFVRPMTVPFDELCWTPKSKSQDRYYSKIANDHQKVLNDPNSQLINFKFTQGTYDHALDYMSVWNLTRPTPSDDRQARTTNTTVATTISGQHSTATKRAVKHERPTPSDDQQARTTNTTLATTISGQHSTATKRAVKHEKSSKHTVTTKQSAQLEKRKEDMELYERKQFSGLVSLTANRKQSVSEFAHNLIASYNAHLKSIDTDRTATSQPFTKGTDSLCKVFRCTATNIRSIIPVTRGMSFKNELQHRLLREEDLSLLDG